MGRDNILLLSKQNGGTRCSLDVEKMHFFTVFFTVSKVWEVGEVF
jgi:hypothetical protein